MQRRHSVLSFAWGAVAVVAAGACAQSAPVKEHGPIYGDDAASDATTDGGGGSEAGDDATSDDGGGGNDATVDSPAETGSGDAAGDSSAGDDGGGDASDAGHGDDASDGASGDDASDGGSATDASDGGSAQPDAGDAGGGIVAPTCDGVIGAGEYGDTTHQDGPTSTGQTWYMTWDDSNLYVAIAGATVSEGNVIYVASSPPGDAGTGLTSGYLYDHTKITALPFAAGVVTYANAYANGGTGPYAEARTPSGGTWGAAQTGGVRLCVTGPSATTREEVIPWSLLGGRPASFGWFGYVAANPNNNPQGYIYGQLPADDPGGGPANSLTYTKYFAVPDATPGVDAPFADEQ